MVDGRKRSWRVLMVMLAALALIASSCGSSSEGDGSATDTSVNTDAEESESDDEEAGGNTTEASIDLSGQEEDSAEAEEEEASEEEAPADAEEEQEPAAEVAGPSGTLRFVEFSAVTTFNPAKSQTAQAAYLYPEYDTLIRQSATFDLVPAIATSWSAPDATTWVFTIGEGITFHDGETLDAEVVAANMNWHAATDGNPNAATWGGFETATADGNDVTVTFAVPQPQFPLEMSMVMGMMVSPAAISADTDLTRAPAGSGPWIWQSDASEAGVTEVYTLFEDYRDPADQGVERVEVTAVPDNTARLNALLTGETDIMATMRDAQIDQAVGEGNSIISVPNYFPHLHVFGREEGTVDGDTLGLTLIRQAIAYSIDRVAYNAAIHDGKGDSLGGLYPGAFGQWHVPSLDSAFEYDPEKAKELLAEAGYPDGITIDMLIMPAIQPHVELVTQMLGASGITINQVQINNGELGPRHRAGEVGIGWGRELLYHPAATYRKWTAENAPWNPFGLSDLQDLDDKMVAAAESNDLATMQQLYGEVASALIERGVVIPLAHGSQNAGVRPGVTGVVLGLNMQAPMPYGVRVDG
jgi:peptide/nickel transport system substrate-binding protein